MIGTVLAQNNAILYTSQFVTRISVWYQFKIPLYMVCCSLTINGENTIITLLYSGLQSTDSQKFCSENFRRAQIEFMTFFCACNILMHSYAIRHQKDQIFFSIWITSCNNKKYCIVQMKHSKSDLKQVFRLNKSHPLSHLQTEWPSISPYSISLIIFFFSLFF